MPLTKSKSKAAFNRNVKTEIKAGKPPKQAVAIAYAVKRKAEEGKKKGGEVNKDTMLLALTKRKKAK